MFFLYASLCAKICAPALQNTSSIRSLATISVRVAQLLDAPPPWPHSAIDAPSSSAEVEPLPMSRKVSQII